MQQIPLGWTKQAKNATLPRGSSTLVGRMRLRQASRCCTSLAFSSLQLLSDRRY